MLTERVPMLCGALAALAYAHTLHPSLGFGDAGEYVAAGAGWGVTHPPGHPLFVLVLHALDVVFPFETPAAVANQFNAVMGVLGVVGWTLAAEAIATSVFTRRSTAELAAAVGGFLMVTGISIWSQAVVLERPILAVMAITGFIVWLTQTAAARAPDAAYQRLRMAWLLTGVAVAVHPIAGPMVVPLAVATATALWGSQGWWAVLKAAAPIGVGLSTFAIPVVRSYFRPWMNWNGLAVCARNVAFLKCLTTSGELHRIVAYLVRQGYDTPVARGRHAAFSLQFGAWWSYLGRQWCATCSVHGGTAGIIAIICFTLCIIGSIMHLQEGPRSASLSYASAAALYTVVLVWQLNLLPFPSQIGGARSFLITENRERDYFFIMGYAFVALWIALSVAGIVEWSRNAMAVALQRIAMRARTASLIAAGLSGGLLAVLGGGILSANGKVIQQSVGPSMALAWAHDILNSVAPNGVLVVTRDDYLWPLDYAQAVEGRRRDVSVLPLAQLDDERLPS
ncbi:MAG: protein O-mannosyl-transferase family, partial [Gemmatimonadaceae bacterium]